MDAFACPHCQGQYRHRRTLLAHVAAAHDQRRYPCGRAGCDETFAYATGRARHQREVHDNDLRGRKPPTRLIQCGCCAYTCAYPSWMRRHYARVHPADAADVFL